MVPARVLVSCFFLSTEPTSISRAGSAPNITAGLTGGWVLNLSDFSPAERVMAGGDCPPVLFLPVSRRDTNTVCHTLDSQHTSVKIRFETKIVRTTSVHTQLGAHVACGATSPFYGVPNCIAPICPRGTRLRNLCRLRSAEVKISCETWLLSREFKR